MQSYGRSKFARKLGFGDKNQPDLRSGSGGADYEVRRTSNTVHRNPGGARRMGRGGRPRAWRALAVGDEAVQRRGQVAARDSRGERGGHVRRRRTLSGGGGVFFLGFRGGGDPKTEGVYL